MKRLRGYVKFLSSSANFDPISIPGFWACWFCLLKHSFKEFVWYCFNNLFSFTVSVMLLLLSGLYKLCGVMLCYLATMTDLLPSFLKIFNNFNCGYIIREICGGAGLWLWQTRRCFVTSLTMNRRAMFGCRFHPQDFQLFTHMNNIVPL